MKKIIHVNRQIVAQNRHKTLDRMRPPISVKCGTQNYKAHAVRFNGPAVLIHRPEKPLACGAKVWLETNADVEILNRNTRTVRKVVH